MAIFSMRIQVIGRSAGRSATAAAAYRSGQQVVDERTGAVHDYTGKSDIYGSEILLPKGAPERLGDRTSLWNEVERVEKRKDAQLSREVMIALPAELTHRQKEFLTREYVQGEFIEQGMIADIGYHDFDSHNPHAHIMLTMRGIDEEGFGKKRREWNKREAIKDYREHWAEYANRALEEAGYDERIDHRSLKEQGIEREPQIHLGAKVMEMEARGVRTQIGDESRRIDAANRDLERKAAQREKQQVDIEAEQVEPQMCVLPELVFSSESERERLLVPPMPPIERSPTLIEQPVEPLPVPAVDLELVHLLGEAIVRRREEMVLEDLPVIDELAAAIGQMTATMNELSAATEDIAEQIDEATARADKEQGVTEAELRQPQQEKGQAMQNPDDVEVTSRSIDSDALAGYQNQIAKATATEPPVEEKQATEKARAYHRRRQIYQKYAAKFTGKSAHECDRLVAQQLMSELLVKRDGQRLRHDEWLKVGSILLQGPIAQQTRRTKGKEAGTTYVMEVLEKAQKKVEKAQSRGMEM